MTDNYSIAISGEHGHGQRLGVPDRTAQHLKRYGSEIYFAKLCFTCERPVL